MTTPTGAQKQAVIDAGINLPSIGTSGASKYGLNTTLASTPVTPGGLAAILGLKATNGTVTADQLMEAFAHASPAQAAKVQAYLQAAQLYSKDYTVNLGVVNQQDLDAFKKVVETVAQTGADASDYLRRQAQFGAYTGLAAALTGKGGVIKTADPLAASKEIDDTYQQLTGRKATAQEKAAFLVAYNAAYAHFQQQQAAAGGSATVDTSGYSTAPITAQDIGMGGLDPTVAHDTSIDSLAQGMDMANLRATPSLPTDPSVTVPDQFDAQAFAEDYVKSHNTGEVGGHDAADTFGMFLNILKGIG